MLYGRHKSTLKHERLASLGNGTRSAPPVANSRPLLKLDAATRTDWKDCECASTKPWSAFTSRRERLRSVSSTRERSVDICSWFLPLDEKLYLAPSASVKNDLSKNVNNRIANDFYKSVNIVYISVCL
ncbi:hypothetical protein TNCV_2779331 [Trichonephila clavipes]|nr:hypothetical protein TNCV_2779331 [Trichonephila clavipes]